MKEIGSILICGYFGDGNAGDESILDSEIRLLRQTTDVAEITVASWNPEYTKHWHDVEKAIPRREVDKETWESEAKTVDNVFIGGGGLYNVSNLLTEYCEIVKWCYDHRIPVHFVGVGVTPVSVEYNLLFERLLRPVLRSTANLLDSLIVRDHQSKRYLNSLGVQTPIDVYPDFAFYKNKTITQDRFDQDDNRLVVIPRDLSWKSKPFDTDGLASALDLIHTLTECNIMFSPTQNRTADISVMEEIQAKLRTKSDTTIPSNNFRDLERLIASSGFVITARLHGAILAAKHGIPFVMISYNPKCENILTDLDWGSVFQYNNINGDDLATSVEDIWTTPNKRKELKRRATIQHEQLTHMFRSLNDRHSYRRKIDALSLEMLLSAKKGYSTLPLSL